MLDRLEDGPIVGSLIVEATGAVTAGRRKSVAGLIRDDDWDAGGERVAQAPPDVGGLWVAVRQDENRSAGRACLVAPY